MDPSWEDSSTYLSDVDDGPSLEEYSARFSAFLAAHPGVQTVSGQPGGISVSGSFDANENASSSLGFSDALPPEPDDSNNSGHSGEAAESVGIDAEVHADVSQQGDAPPTARDALCEGLVSIIDSHPGMSQKAGQAVLTLLKQTHPHFHGLPESIKTAFKGVNKTLPTVLMDVLVSKQPSGDIVELRGLRKCKRAYVHDIEAYKPLQIVTYVNIDELLKFQSELTHTCTGTDSVALSVDGVPISKSSGRSFVIFSATSLNCKTVLPLIVVETFNHHKPDLKVMLQSIITDLCYAGKQIHHIICDLPMKGKIACLKQAGGYFPCSYCLIKGKHLRGNGRHGSKRIYPARARQRKRTLASVKRITSSRHFRHWLRHSQRYRSKLQGLTGKSVLLQIPGFDITKDLPVDYLHMFCLGVMRQTLKQTFDCGTPRTPGCTYRRASAARFNDGYSKVKVPTEQQRKTRPLQVGVWKGSEYKLLGLFTFPHLLRCLQHHPDTQRRLLRDVWLTLVFVMRAVMLEEEEFQALEAVTNVEMECRVFSRLYEQYFGSPNMTFNVHQVRHLKEVYARYGPLTKVSAFGYEDFYRLFGQGYHPGTASLAKQGMYNVLRKAKLQKHSCQQKVIYQVKESYKTCDNIIYTKGFNFYRLRGFNASDGTVSAQKIICAPTNWQRRAGQFNRLPFHLVGAKLVIVERPGEVILQRGEILGKAVLCSGWVVAYSERLLGETS